MTCRVCGAETEPAFIEIDPQSVDVFIEADDNFAACLLLCTNDKKHMLSEAYWNSIKDRLSVKKAN